MPGLGFGPGLGVWLASGLGPPMPVHGHSQADEKQVEFRFDEDLCFNIPFKPVVSVTGRCVLTRDPQVRVRDGASAGSRSSARARAKVRVS